MSCFTRSKLAWSYSPAQQQQKSESQRGSLAYVTINDSWACKGFDAYSSERFSERTSGFSENGKIELLVRTHWGALQRLTKKIVTNMRPSSERTLGACEWGSGITSEMLHCGCRESEDSSMGLELCKADSFRRARKKTNADLPSKWSESRKENRTADHVLHAVQRTLLCSCHGFWRSQPTFGYSVRFCTCLNLVACRDSPYCELWAMILRAYPGSGSGHF
jgi:hypothetical protein